MDRKEIEKLFERKKRALEKTSPASGGAPYLHSVYSLSERWDWSSYPFNVKAFTHGIHLRFDKKVTFFVGENGAGKSTLLEAIAELCGFPQEGGNHDHYYATFGDRSPLAEALRLSWTKRSDGFFLRAESFYNFATYIDQVSSLRAYGGKSLHQQSHGESFLALFKNRFEHGIYILDEPEAALSPQRQLAFLRILYELDRLSGAQFLISTHSPIILAYPDADIFNMDGDSIEKIGYHDTEHYQTTRSFLNNPEKFFNILFED